MTTALRLIDGADTLLDRAYERVGLDDKQSSRQFESHIGFAREQLENARSQLPTDDEDSASSAGEAASDTPTSRREQLAARSYETIQENQAGASILTDIALLQRIPGTEVDVTPQCNQRVRVRRNGIIYGINERTGPSTGGKLGRYVYAVGADLGDGLEFPVQRTNCYGSLHDALHALRKCILFDPRQDDIPAKYRATHFSVSVPVPATNGDYRDEDAEGGE